jgi:spore germination protein (amino acid permease)
MNSEGKIGVFEAISFVSVITVNKIFFTSVGSIISQTGTAAWYTTLISCVVTVVVFMLVYMLLKRFPGKDLAAIFEIVAGRFIGKLLILAISAYCVFNAGSTLREFVEMIKVYNLPYTPTSLIISLFLVASLIISRYGFQAIARLCAICFIPSMAGLVFILLLSANRFNFNLLNPIGGHGLEKTIMFGLSRSSAYNEFLLLAFTVNALEGHRDYKKAALTSILISGVVFSISLLCYLSIYGYTSGSENISGVFELSRSIYFNRYVQRLESVFLFIWVISSVITTTASYYISMLLYCKTFRIKDHLPILLPFAILVYIVAILPQSMQEVTQKNITFLRQYSLYIMYLIPAAILLLAFITRKKGDIADA